MQMPTTTPELDDSDVYYPGEDGEPMGETFIHVKAIIDLFTTLRAHLGDRPDVFLASDIFWYWEKGNNKARRAPDVMLIKGVDGRSKRQSFFTWRENGAVPCVIFEFSSEGTWKEDLFEKRFLYARLGVRELFLFDPENLLLYPQLQGFRLNAQGESEPIQPDRRQRLWSEELGLWVQPGEQLVRLTDPKNGRPILNPDEQAQAALKQVKAAKKRTNALRKEAKTAKELADALAREAKIAKEHALAIEAENARLRHLVEQLRKKQRPE